MTDQRLPHKPVFKSTEPDSFDINISDQSGLRTLFLSVSGIVGILLTVYLITRVLLHYSPLFVSVELENKIFKNTHSYLFRDGVYSKPLTKFAKQLDPDNKDVEVFIINMPEPNAFCFLGNKLFVTTTLLQTAESENELAFVLSHELGHAKLRHNLKNLSVNLIMGVVFSFVDFLKPASQFLASGYSRSMESEADDFALQSITELYGHTYGAESFFVRLRSQQSPIEKEYIKFTGDYLATHPDTEKRIAKILETQKIEELNKKEVTKVIARENSKIFKSLEIKTR